MILQTLANYYDLLLNDEDSGISQPGYSKTRVSFAAVISSEGDLVDLEDLRVQSGKKLIGREMNVPEQIKKTSGVASNFLCENASYFFGIPIKGDEGKSQKEHQKFKELHLELLENLHSKEGLAIKAFLENWNPTEAMNSEILKSYFEDLKTANIVFKLDGNVKPLHNLNEFQSVWENYKSVNESRVIGQCLISGEILPLARLHPSIKGVIGSQTSGASIVSFNLEAFTSYGKDQSFNAPISEKSTFAYTTSLNYLLGNRDHNIRIGDTTIVYWAEKSLNNIEESIFAEIFSPSTSMKDSEETTTPMIRRDPEVVRIVQRIMEKLKNGLSIRTAATEFDPNVKFYILGLAPNASRLSIRFWNQDNFGDLIEKMLQHQLDMDVERPENLRLSIPPWMILKEAAVRRDLKNISPILAGNLAKSIFTGLVYGDSLFTQILGRIRVEGQVNDIRAGIMKACMKRKARKLGDLEKEALYTVSLNEHNLNKGYLLGRLFAVLEKAQQDVTQNLNASIKDRYFGAASATPQSVFPVLIKLSQHHMAKSNYGSFRDREIQKILEKLESFPAHLNLEEQGNFILGYYHQKQSFYKPAEEKTTKEEQ